MEARLSLRLQYLPCSASTVSGVCLTASTVTVTSWMLQIKPSPDLLQGSKVELHPLAHAQFAIFNSVQRLSPKKGASDKNSRPVMDKLYVVVMRKKNQTRYTACSVAAVFTRRWLHYQRYKWGNKDYAINHRQFHRYCACS